MSLGRPSLRTRGTGRLLGFNNDSLFPRTEFVDLPEQIHLFRNANDTVELGQGRTWLDAQPKGILQPDCSATQRNEGHGLEIALVVRMRRRY